MIAVDLSKQEALDANRKAIQQINFTANLEQEIQESISFLKKRKNYLRLFARNCKSFVSAIFLNDLILINIK